MKFFSTQKQLKKEYKGDFGGRGALSFYSSSYSYIKFLFKFLRYSNTFWGTFQESSWNIPRNFFKYSNTFLICLRKLFKAPGS